jgi:hypothetical protein
MASFAPSSEPSSAQTYICFESMNINSNCLDFKDNLSDYGIKEIEEVHYTKLWQYILSKVEIDKIFCDGIDPGYIERHFKTGNAIIIISNSDNIDDPNFVIYSFAILTIAGKWVIIELICSNKVKNNNEISYKGYGAMLVNTIINAAKKTNYHDLGLVSSSTAIEFYKKLGFKMEDEKCTIGCFMHIKFEEEENDANSVTGGKYKSKKSRSKKNRSKNKKSIKKNI